MKAFLVNLVVIGLLVTTFGTIAHAETLTLDDCITLALQNRASIIAARGAEDLAKADKRAALGAFLPRASAYYDYRKSYQRDVTSQEIISTRRHI
jgi:outer membrane protein TolC